MVPQECSQHQEHSVAGKRSVSKASDELWESSSGCREDPGTKHGPDQGCSRGMSASQRNFRVLREGVRTRWLGRQLQVIIDRS